MAAGLRMHAFFGRRNAASASAMRRPAPVVHVWPAARSGEVMSSRTRSPSRLRYRPCLAQIGLVATVAWRIYTSTQVPLGIGPRHPGSGACRQQAFCGIERRRWLPVTPRPHASWALLCDRVTSFKLQSGRAQVCAARCPGLVPLARQSQSLPPTCPSVDELSAS